MKAGTYNIHIAQGTLYEKLFNWSSSGSGVNLTGYHAQLEVEVEGAVVLNVTDVLDGNGNGLVLDSSGNVQIVLKTAMTRSFTFTQGDYKCQLTRPDGEDLPFLEGGFYVEPEFINE